MYPATSNSHQLDDSADGDGFGRDRDAGQAKAAGYFTLVRNAIARQPVILRLQPDGKAEGSGVFHGAQQRFGIDHRLVGLRKGNTTGLLQTGQFGQTLTLEAKGQRAERENAGFADLVTAMNETIGQFRFIERRISIRRYHDTGYATSDGRGQFGLDGVEASPKIDQPRTNDTARGVNALVGNEARRRSAKADDRTFSNEQGGIMLVDTVLRIDDAAVLDFDIHVQFPATMLMTAMRTAIPKVTWGRITACAPSATAERLSPPRFIGPGCIRMASGLASANFCGVRP